MSLILFMAIIVGLPAGVGFLESFLDKRRGVQHRPVDTFEYHQHAFLPQNYWNHRK